MSNNATNSVITTPSDARYMKIRTVPSYGTTYKNDICINISKTTGSPKNGDYVPYEKHSHPLDSSLTLNGILKLSGDEIYADGDVYGSDGTVNERYAEVDLGTLNWTYNTTDTAASAPYFMTTLSNPKYGAGMMSSKYPNTGGGRNTLTDKTMALYNMSNSPNICIADSSFTDAASFKTAMSGVRVNRYDTAPSTSGKSKTGA